MKTERKTPSKTYAIPLDMLMDILKIVMTHELPNYVEGISVKQNIIMLNVKFPVENPYSAEIKENIETHLSDYGYFTSGSPQDRSFGSGMEIENEF